MATAARRTAILLVALLGCAHRQAAGQGSADSRWVPAARLTGPDLVRPVLVPAHPAPARPGPEVDRRLARFAGAWEGTWSDGSASVLVVLSVRAREARLLLAMDGGGDLSHPGWHEFAIGALAAEPEPTLTWRDGASTTTLTLGEDGRLAGHIEGPKESMTASLRRRAVELRAGPPDEAPLVCPTFAPEAAAIAGESDPARRARRADALVERARAAGGPLIGPGRAPGTGCATFLWRGEAAYVAVASDLNGWSRARDLMARLPGTDLFHAGFELPEDARVDYKLRPDGHWALDPLNPRTMTGGYGPNSELRMPAYRPPAEVERRLGIPAGTVEPLTLRSRHLGNGRKARIYLPPGYADTAERYPVAYLHDGDDELDFGALDAILDNLIAARALPPLIAVLVPPVRRDEEYRRDPAFEAFFLEEVVPAVDARYRTRATPAGRVVGGISLGGLAAVSLALGHPEVFGGCISQSGAFGAKLAGLLELAAAAPPPPGPRPRVWLDVGRFESVMDGRDLLRESRRLRDALSAGRFQVGYLEVPEGHSWGSWRARIGQAIAFALAGAAP